MKVKDLLLELSAFDPEAEIVIGYEFPLEFRDPDFERTPEDLTSTEGQSLPKGSYICKS